MVCSPDVAGHPLLSRSNRRPVFKVPFYIPGTEWGFSVPVTVNKAWFGIVQMSRMLTMAILAIPIPYTMDPNIYGVAFRRMGASDKFSFAMDLAFRFLPTFARDFTTTVDAQRARGYEMEALKGGIVAKLRRLAPLIIPVTMQATVTGEDVIDAMDLRAFDTNKRTWIKELHYARRDYFMLGLGASIFVTCCLLKWVFGVGGSSCQTFSSRSWDIRETYLQKQPPIWAAAFVYEGT